MTREDLYVVSFFVGIAVFVMGLSYFSNPSEYGGISKCFKRPAHTKLQMAIRHSWGRLLGCIGMIMIAMGIASPDIPQTVVDIVVTFIAVLIGVSVLEIVFVALLGEEKVDD